MSASEPTPGLRQRIMALESDCHDYEGLQCEDPFNMGSCSRSVAREDVLALLAASPAPEPTGLDEDVLRQAMDAVVPESIPPFYWTNERLARAIAAEYARLKEAT